jgi:hypothetical protein
MDLYPLIKWGIVFNREIMIQIFIGRNKIKLNLDKKMEQLELLVLLKEKVFKDILEFQI